MKTDNSNSLDNAISYKYIMKSVHYLIVSLLSVEYEHGSSWFQGEVA